MRDLKIYYMKENDRVKNSYCEGIERIKEIVKEIVKDTGCCCNNKGEYFKFFKHAGNFILKMSELEEKVNEDYFKNNSFEFLLASNKELFDELREENYEKSYANPSYTAVIFGKEMGQLISVVYTGIRNYISYAFCHKIFKMGEYNKLFIEIYDYVKNNEINFNEVREIVKAFEKKDLTFKREMSFKEIYDKNMGYFNDVVNKCDLKDLRYLFRFGLNISENEIKTAEFLNTYSEEKIKKLSKTIAKAMARGYVVDQKDKKNRRAVRLLYNLGYERLIRYLIEDLKEYDLDGYVNSGLSTSPNKQFEYDHRFDNALYIDEEYVKLLDEGSKEGAERIKDIFADFAGILLFDKFGEVPFSPKSKEEALKLNDEQQKLNMAIRNNHVSVIYKNIPEEERSFCIVGFPMPEIGENFSEIFEDILEINMLDTDKYMGMQRKIIDVLDRAEFVHVKGVQGNKTDIMVKMHEIKNPEGETNFFNCGADVNIPVGEVFTSPLLNGTTGTLHVEDIYLNDLRFLNLEIKFQDGYIVDYTCSNFKTQEENRKYIEENLLFPHKTLPIGEFAIGTNTLAYSIAKKYNILDKMPILIIEKMGPHFAIGDTCYSRDEDRKTCDIISGKEIKAKENERSRKRNENPTEAYTNVHTDITLPYESLSSIAAITRDGESISIIEKGKFVVKGTEELNKYL